MRYSARRLCSGGRDVCEVGPASLPASAGTEARPTCLHYAGGALLAAAALLGIAGGCEVFGGKRGSSGLPPYLVRMRAAYPDLASGRFLCLAHFETPGQAELFRIVDAAGNAGALEQPSISIVRSRNETGSGGLYAPLPAADDELRLDAVRSHDLALWRDWREYALLLCSVYGPPDGARIRMSVRSGDAVPLEWSRAFELKPGWQTLRVDLAEVGESADLADVRCVAWRVERGALPVPLFLDDVILADNTKYLTPEPNAPDALYVFEQGRRLHVGVRGRYELAFADGLIVAWYAEPPSAPPAPATPQSMELAPTPTSAPAALPRANLAPPSGLGPYPVPLPADWFGRQPPIAYDAPDLYARWGGVVESEQVLLEASAARVVVQGQWRFINSPTNAAPGAPPTSQPAPTGATATSAPGSPVPMAPPTTAPTQPAHTWQYVIYPTGEVFVRVASGPPAEGWGVPRVGYAVEVRARMGFDLIHGGEQTPDARSVLFTRRGPHADLLWVPYATTLMERCEPLASRDGRRLAALCGDQAAGPLVESAHLLRVFPYDIDTAPDAESFALDYRYPAQLTMTVGSLVTNAPGDLDRDGYNEGEGVYELEAKDGLLRAQFDPVGRIRYAPRLRIRGLRDRQCWLYQDGQILSAQARDRHGDLLITLPGPRQTVAAIEVHSQPAAAPKP